MARVQVCAYHEERVRALYQSLKLVLAGLVGRSRIQ